MNRLLICHEKSEVSVYSLNKQAKVQTVSFTLEDIQTKGKILACEWLFNESEGESTQFAIGFSEGSLEIYKADGSKKPLRILNFEITNLYKMQLFY